MTFNPTRRTWLKTCGSALATAALRPSDLLSQEAARPSAYTHRCSYGWITDIATDPDAQEAWPAMRLDDRLLQDYRAYFDVLRRIGFNEVVIWGLYVSRAWPADVAGAVTPERGALVEKLIEAAHERGIRVYSGLGVYSWGFDHIIRDNPKVRRNNPSAMCGSEPASWTWMQKVTDFVFERFAIDGVNLQSADQGRCGCADCKAYSDGEYHALLNVRVADYIRGRWPKKTIGVSGWGMKFSDPASYPALAKISRKVDYIIDVFNTGKANRKELIQSLACPFGTLGGPNVRPPQHWERDRWFLPTVRGIGEHLRRLWEDGGRACEIFHHYLANPGDEVSLWVAGKTLTDPGTPWQKHLESSVEELYRVTAAPTRDALCQLVLKAEEAYLKYRPGHCGTILLEPLQGARAGRPIYLTQTLKAPERDAYASEIQSVKEEAEKLLPDVPHQGKMKLILRCLGNVLKDLAEIRAGR